MNLKKCSCAYTLCKKRGIQAASEVELTKHLGYKKHFKSDNTKKEIMVKYTS